MHSHPSDVNTELLNRISTLREQINQGLATDPREVAQEIETIISLTEQLLESQRRPVSQS